MTTLSEAKKRDFASQIITLLLEEKTVLTENGFDPTARTEKLIIKNKASDEAEIAQQLAAAHAKDATTLSIEKLAATYSDASNIADLISGLLGKENEIVKKIRKFRK